MTDCTRLEGLGAQQVGVVQRVGDRLAGDPGARRRPSPGSVAYAGAGRATSGAASADSGRLPWWTGSCDSPELLIVPNASVTAPGRVVPGNCRCRSPSVRAMAKPTATAPAPTLPLRRVRLGDRQVGRPLRRVPGLGHASSSAAAPQSRVQAGPVTAPAVPIGEVPIEDSQARTSGVPELDRVLGGGLVPGAAILLAGEPGVGKSTLLLEVAAQTARAAAPRALRHRRGVRRPGAACAPTAPAASRTSSTSPPRPTSAPCSATSRRSSPTLLVIDSVQTISAGDVDGVPGGVTQVKEVAAALIRMAKLRNITTVIVGHVTKDGSIAGPRVLEHLVDVVLHFEGERTSRLRMVRAVKNRFGPVDEVGCFDLSAEGIVAITDPTGLFLDTRHGPVPGTCVAVDDGGPPAAADRGAGAGHPHAAERPRRTTSGRRLLPGGDDPGRAPAARRHPAAQPRRVRLHRRRCPADRAEQRPRDRARDRLGLRRASRSAATWSRSASSGCPASCAGSATSACGWPRPAGSGFRSAAGARGHARRRPRGQSRVHRRHCGWSTSTHVAPRLTPARSWRRSRQRDPCRDLSP